MIIRFYILFSSLMLSCSAWSANITGANGLLQFPIPAGEQDGTNMCVAADTSLLPENIRYGVSIFNMRGSEVGEFALYAASAALRGPAVGLDISVNDGSTNISSQITLKAENSTYAGSSLPATGGYKYRDVADSSLDMQDYNGVFCRFAVRPSVTCGHSQSTVAARIADCAAKNPSTSSWNGAVLCNSSQGLWKLVSRKSANNEVWQDQRTGLLWSSAVATGVNWCLASGNTQAAPVIYKRAYNTAETTAMSGSGTISEVQGGTSSVAETVTVQFSNATTFTVSGSNCGSSGATTALGATSGESVVYDKAGYCSFRITQGDTPFAAGDTFKLVSYAASTSSCHVGGALRGSSTVSYCAEADGLTGGGSENWSQGLYSDAKGGMGKSSTPVVRWRLPNLRDWHLAIYNGLDRVMPHLGAPGSSRLPAGDSTPGWNSVVYWLGTVSSNASNQSWTVQFDSTLLFGEAPLARNTATGGVFCVGRY